MANREFYYYYVPTWDCPPDGPVSLGNVIKTPKKPHQPLTCCPPDDSETFGSTKKEVHYSKEKSRSGKFSILTEFLSAVLGLGADAGVGMGKSAAEEFVFKSIETTEFVPTQAYLQYCISDKEVRRYLKRTRYRQPVYIITGHKIVSGAEAWTSNSRNIEGTVAVKVDGTLMSGGTVPLSGGSGIEGSTDKKSRTAWGDSSDFVFAFRVTQVFVNVKDGQVQSEKEYQDGAMLGECERVTTEPEIEIIRVEVPRADDEGWSHALVVDDDDTVAVAIPRKQEVFDS